MPRKTKLRRRSVGFTNDHKAALSSHDYFSVFDDEDHERAAWEALRDELLPDWIANHPGTRPRPWWQFDAPGRRERIDGGIHPFDDPTNKTEHRMFMGKPARLRPCDIDAVYETETQFLRRQSLLTDTELHQLSGKDAPNVDEN